MIREGTQSLRRENLPRAEHHFRQVLRLAPNHPWALHWLGIVHYKRGHLDKAEELVRRSIQLGPGEALFHEHLGTILKCRGDTSAAAKSYARALELEPNDPSIHKNLGILLLEAGAYREAEVLLRKAVELAPDDAEALMPLAALLRKQGKNAEAQSIYRTILDLEPDHPAARHFLASLDEEAPGTAPTGYVVGLFDHYADVFDDHLTEKLGYRTPENLRRAVGRATGLERAAWRILDLGCGTGLCGVNFRDLAGHMAGVDLSPGMLEKAREKDVYDTLRQDHLVEALRAEAGNLDLTVAADVFIYVGDLDPVFAACADALKEGGLFAFSTESFSGEGFLLRPSGRFAHSPRYVQQMAEKYGFSEVLREETIIRKEDGKPIAGHIFVLCRGRWEKKTGGPAAFCGSEAGVRETYETARLHHQAGHLAQAESLYRRVLRTEPEHADALHFLGVITHQRGDSEAAAGLIRRAIEKNPGAPHYHTNLGIVLYAQGRPDEAIAAMEKSLELNPASLETLNNLACLLTASGKPDEAAEKLQRALALSPGFAQGHNHIAEIYKEQGRAEEAEDHYRKAVEAGPEYADGHRNLARFLLSRGRRDEAAKACRRLLKLQPEDEEGRRMLEACGAQAGAAAP